MCGGQFESARMQMGMCTVNLYNYMVSNGCAEALRECACNGRKRLMKSLRMLMSATNMKSVCISSCQTTNIIYFTSIQNAKH